MNKTPNELHDTIDEAVKIMSLLNRGAAEAMNTVGINACTDITGYGLLGHLLEMCKASKVSASIEFNKLPIIQGAFELAQKGFVPGGTKNNLDFVASNVNFSENLSKEEQYLMADAQTSGGLLISVSQDKAESLQYLLNEHQCLASNIIGEVNNPEEVSIYIN